MLPPLFARAQDAIRVMNQTPTEGNGKDVTPAILSIAFICPDERIYKLLRDHCFIVKPPYWNGQVTAYAIVPTKDDKLKDIPWTIRMALTDSGLVHPEDLGIVSRLQLKLGWPETPPSVP